MGFLRFKNIFDTSFALFPGLWNDIALLQFRLVAVLIAKVAHRTFVHPPVKFDSTIELKVDSSSRNSFAIRIFSRVGSFLTTRRKSSLSLISERAFHFLDTNNGCGEDRLKHSELPSKKTHNNVYGRGMEGAWS